jgi:hypothetical protein
MFNLKKSLQIVIIYNMDEVDYDINNYSIEDMKTLLGLTDIFNTKQIYDTTNAYIKLSETKNNPNMANLFRDIQHFLITYTSSVTRQNNVNDYEDDDDPRQQQQQKQQSNSEIADNSLDPDEWMSPVFSQTSSINQKNKITDRTQKITLYDNDHVPMKSQQLGVTNTYNLPVVQDKLNPTLKNSYSRFIVLDSQYRQGSNGGTSTDYLADLSDIMNKVLSIRLYSIQIPYSWYIFDSNYLNNYFIIELEMTSGIINKVPINITSGNYTVSELVTELNTQITTALITTGIVFDYTSISSKMKIKFTSPITYNGSTLVSKVNIIFYETNWSATSGIPFSFNQTLGWYLGYRNIIYNDIGQSGTSLNAEAVVDISGPRYVILSIDDFNQNHINNGLVTITETSKNLKIPDYYQSSAVYSSTVYGKTLEQSAQEVTASGGNILNYSDKMGTSFRRTQVVGVGPDGKQTLTQSQIYTINEILKNNSISTTYRNLAPTTPDVLAIIPVKPGSSGRLYVDFSGALQENKRVYFGPVDIERLKIRLFNDRGQILNLNGLDWSFTLCAELLYQY